MSDAAKDLLDMAAEAKALLRLRNRKNATQSFFNARYYLDIELRKAAEWIISRGVAR